MARRSPASSDLVFNPYPADEAIRRAWENEPQHYGGKFPDLEDKAQEFANVISAWLCLPHDVFVRVKDIDKCYAKWDRKNRIYVTMTAGEFYADPKWDLADGMKAWKHTILHEMAHVETFRWYQCGGHPKVFQIIEQQMMNGFGYRCEYTRTPGYWRRVYDLDGNLMADWAKPPTQRFKV